MCSVEGTAYACVDDCDPNTPLIVRIGRQLQSPDHGDSNGTSLITIHHLLTIFVLISTHATFHFSHGAHTRHQYVK